MKKIALVLVAVLSLACASTGGFKHGATVALGGTQAALALIQDTDMQLACGKPTAPATPACIPTEIHKKIEAKLAAAFKLHGDSVDALRALPPTATSVTPEILAEIGKLWALIADVEALFPSGDQTSAMQANVAKLKG